MNKTISHLHMFFFKLTHHYLNLHRLFIAVESIPWIFFIFWHSKIHVSPTSIVSFFFPLWCRLSSGRRCHTATSCHTSFPWSQDDLAASFSSSGNGVASPPVDVATPSRHVTLPSHGVKTSSLSHLHLLATLCLTASPIELKPKHLIRTTTASQPTKVFIVFYAMR
jgi:hypothetical protein